MIRFTSTNEEKKQQIVNYLMKHENVLWLVDVGGRWDILVNFMAQDIIQYSTILREFKNKFPEQIQNYDVLRMKSLKKRGIIKGFKPLIHLDMLGYQGYKLLVKFQNITEIKEKKIIQEIQEYIKVVGILRLVGLWDFEVE